MPDADAGAVRTYRQQLARRDAQREPEVLAARQLSYLRGRFHDVNLRLVLCWPVPCCMSFMSHAS